MDKVDVSNLITTEVINLKALMSSFHNANGNDSETKAINTLFAIYGFSGAPTLSQIKTLSDKSKVDLLFQVASISKKALGLEEIVSNLISIDPGEGAFDTLEDVESWINENAPGLIGIQVLKYITAMKKMRQALEPFVSDDLLKTLCDAIVVFNEINTAQKKKPGA